MLSQILIAALAAATITTAPATPLKPAGKWIVRYDDAQCSAARQFETPAGLLTLVLKVPAQGDVVQLAFNRKGRKDHPTEVDGKIQFGDLPTLEVSALDYETPSGGVRTLLINLPTAAVQQGRAEPTMQANIGGITAVLPLNQLPQVLKTLDHCVADLRRVWNVGVDLQKGPLLQAARGNLVSLFKSSDYPAQAAVESKAGTTTMVVLINEEGRVADCSVVATSGAAILDSQSCAIVTERARFAPAIGIDGRPAKHVFTQRITWRVK